MEKVTRSKYIGLSVIAALTATGLGAVVLPGANRSLNDPLSIIRKQSPGVRTGAVVSTKIAPKRVARIAPARVRPAKVAIRRPRPVSAVLPTYRPAPMPVTVTAPPVYAPPPPVIYSPVLAAAPSAGRGALGLLVIPAVVVIHGGGHSHTDFAPSTPEPDTWLMMIVGFGFLGLTIRRRRRELRRAGATGSTLTGASFA